MKFIFKSFLNFMVAIIYGILTFQVGKYVYHLFESTTNFKIGSVLFIIFISFVLLYGVIISIITTVMCIVYMVKFIFNLLYDKKELMTIIVDQDNVIQGSYIEFKDGKVIPIHIARVNIESFNKQPDMEENIDE